MTQPQLATDLQSLLENIPKEQKTWLIIAELYSRAGENFKNAYETTDVNTRKCFKASAQIYQSIAQTLEENNV
jgi:hypothetical protein